jgi:hypothetical protein
MEVQSEKLVVENKRSGEKKNAHIPDFLIIGAGKSGTTSLDNYLKQHPEIFVSDFKEPNFFGYEMVNRESFKSQPEELHHYDISVTNLSAYLALFENALPSQVLGETSNTYMYHEGAPERIRYYNPDMKLIAVLRQPAGRLYSRYLHLARENRTPTEKFEDCLDRNTIWWERNDLIKEGFYYRNLAKFYELFPKENIRVFLYEEFNSNPQDVLKQIYEFLGVDSTFQNNFSVRYNESGFIKNRFLDKIYGQKGILTGTIKALIPRGVFDTLKQSLFFQKQLNDLRSKNLVKPKLDPKVRHALTHEVYGEDIRQLSKLIGRDLSHWLDTKEKN